MNIMFTIFCVLFKMFMYLEVMSILTSINFQIPLIFCFSYFVLHSHGNYFLSCELKFDFFSVKYSQLSYYYLLKDGGAWWAAVHGVTKSRTRLSNFTITFHFHALEKEMATHSSVLAWRIPGMGEPGGLPSMGSHRVGHD